MESSDLYRHSVHGLHGVKVTDLGMKEKLDVGRAGEAQTSFLESPMRR